MKIDSSTVISDFDPHFKVFHELMSFKVQEILLVSSLYDAFILEEDGSLATRLIDEYHGLNLSKAPKITRASSPQEALRLIAMKNYDLVITMPYLQGMNGFELGVEIKKIRPALPVILVAHNRRSTIAPNEKCKDGIDAIYLWSYEADILLAIIKNVEDCFNVDTDTKRAMVRVIIYVEDSPAYRSLFLPLMYQELVGQTQAVLDESLNERHRLLRMRARPRILMAENYEEAVELFEKYRPYVFGVISDARFNRGGKIDPHAGHAFLQHVHLEEPDIPLLMVSSEEENRVAANLLPAGFINKNSPAIQSEFHGFFLSRLGFGDFVFKLPNGQIIDRASNMAEFDKSLRHVPDECIDFHLKKNHFFNWVMARAEVILAEKLHRDKFSENKSITAVRRKIIEKVHALRELRQRGIVVNFSGKEYDPEIMDFVKIGTGSMGGKARGLAFMWACLQGAGRQEPLLSAENVTIPKTCVIAADGFDAFINENNIRFTKDYDDEKIVNFFLDAELPSWLRCSLRSFLRKWDMPFSVRSSSLLEDAQFKPYAGLYATYFVSNNNPSFEQRLTQLESAIKLVYASTWFESPKAFSKTSIQSRDDSMAVIIQALVGSESGGYWYPSISGVAQSHNYYPVMNMDAADGIAHIALGVGKTVVEGGKSLWFSPVHPKKLVQFSSVEDILANSQRQFYALDMNPESCFDLNQSNLVLRNVQDAANELPVVMLSSTYVPEEHRIRDAAVPGVKIMTFAQFLKYSSYPLGGTLRELLSIGKTAMGCDVEIEFAVGVEEDITQSTFYFLQIRPMITGGEQADVQICEADLENAFCASSQVLGHGKIQELKDILYVDPDTFDPAQTQTIASEIGVMGRKLAAKSCGYLLVGPGRWGTSDPWLGVPVQWSDISGVRAIVEVQDGMIRAEPSQGSHFFQNITSLGIPYFTVRSAEQEENLYDYVDWHWLKAQPEVERGLYVKHIRLDKGFVVKCDGKKLQGVILKGEKVVRGEGLKSCAS